MKKVTIGLPTLNRVEYLTLSLESALGQTYPNLEIIVSENACTDATAAMLATIVDPRVRTLHQSTTLSMVGNWNATLSAATGEYFLLLSDDDLLEPRAIEKMVATYENSEEAERVGFVYCRGRVIDAEGRVRRRSLQAPLREEAPALILAFFHGERETWPCSILLRRSDMAGGYSSDFLVITDAAMWMKAVIRRGCALFVDEDLVRYRLHESLTAATKIGIWQEENTKLAALAIRDLESAGRANAELVKQIKRALQRLNQRIVITLSMSSSDKRRSVVLAKFVEYLPQFTTYYGISMMARALVVVLLPAWVRKILRSARGRLSPSSG